MKAMLIAVALLASVASLEAKDKKPDTRVTLYVWTAVDPSGFVDADGVMRAKAVKAFRQQRWTSKRWRLVETQEEAQLVLEVTHTGEPTEETNGLAVLSNGLNALAGGLASLRPRSDERQLVTYRYATLTVGAYETELKGRFLPSNGGGSALAFAVEEWVKVNQEKVLAVTSR